MSIQPWIKGPLELLKHGLDHLKAGGGFDQRMAMISIDNSVELMIKTYINLPKRITGINLSRKKYEEVSQKFPDLISTLENLAPEKIVGIELGEIEWFHRIRNNLYHNGNGITIDKEMVQIYSENAKTLFYNLFKLNVEDFMEGSPSSLIGEFFKLWAFLEQNIALLYSEAGLKNYNNANMAVEALFKKRVINDSFMKDFNSMRQFRNATVHGLKLPSSEELNINITNLKKLLDTTQTLTIKNIP